MLVLTRKEEESIIINDDIEIKIIGIRQDQVKIGIVAPKDIKVYRKEIYSDIQNANIASAVNPETLQKLKGKIPPTPEDRNSKGDKK